GYLAKRYELDEEEIATIGDMPNDVLMFARSGLSIAMGQSGREVHRAARHVTTTNDDDGFADAGEKFILYEDSYSGGYGHSDATRDGGARPHGRGDRPAAHEGRAPLRRLRRLPGRRKGARGGRRDRLDVARGLRGEAREAPCGVGDGARGRDHGQDDRVA